jgi:alpha-tubulin suppressor-like RCC1 family protein
MPVAVVGGHRFTSLSAGENHTCGVAKNGKAWCWGAGGFGRLGDGITKGHLTGTPVAVVGGHTFAHP